MVVTERRLLEKASSFEERAMEKVFAMSGTWALVHMTKLGDIGFEGVIESIFSDGITEGPITAAAFVDGYRGNDYRPNEIVWIVDSAYCYANSKEFAKQYRWEFIGTIPPKYISGVILPAPSSAVSGGYSEILSDAELAKKNQAILHCLLSNMEKSDNPMPVYLTDGSLLWPQELNFEQVQSITG